MIAKERMLPMDLNKTMSRVSIALAVLMIVVGFAAIAIPLATGIVISLLLCWVIVVAGLFYIAHTVTDLSGPGVVWRALIGVGYVIGGVYLAFHPGLALQALTLIVAIVLTIEGLLRAAAFFHARSVPGAGWILFDAVITLLLAALIATRWPSSSWWAIGMLVGVNLLFSGFTRLMYSVATQKQIQTAQA
jgi:uncharacterized membrane protein HdeD (DUF308 family)